MKKEKFSSAYVVHLKDRLHLWVLHTQMCNYDARQVSISRNCTLRTWNYALHAAYEAHLTNDIVMQVDVLCAFYGFVMSLLRLFYVMQYEWQWDRVRERENGNNCNKWPFISSCAFRKLLCNGIRVMMRMQCKNIQNQKGQLHRGVLTSNFFWNFFHQSAKTPAVKCMWGFCTHMCTKTPHIFCGWPFCSHMCGKTPAVFNSWPFCPHVRIFTSINFC